MFHGVWTVDYYSGSKPLGTDAVSSECYAWMSAQDSLGQAGKWVYVWGKWTQELLAWSLLSLSTKSMKLSCLAQKNDAPVRCALTFICWWSVARSMHFLGLRGTMPRSKLNAPSPYVASILFPKQRKVHRFYFSSIPRWIDFFPTHRQVHEFCFPNNHRCSSFWAKQLSFMWPVNPLPIFLKENRCRKRETNESCQCWDGFRNFNHLRQRHAKFTQFTSSLFHTNYSRFHCFHFLRTSRSSHRVHVR